MTQFSYTDVANEIMPNVAAIERCMSRGMRAAEAMDYVLGDGAYAAFASQVWHNIRAKEARRATTEGR